MSLERRINKTYLEKKKDLSDILTGKGVVLTGDESFSNLLDSINTSSIYFRGEYSKTVSITWNDDTNARNIRPNSVRVFLCYNNERIGVCTLNPSNHWSYTFTELTYNDNYSILVPDLEYYSKSVSGLNATYNIITYNLTLNLSIAGEPEGVDMSRLRVTIYGSDPACPISLYHAQLLNGYTFNLIEGVYTIYSNNFNIIEGYYLDVNNGAKTSMMVDLDTNKSVTFPLVYSPLPEEEEVEFIDIPVVITWNDSNNTDGNRPASVTVRLYTDGVEVDSHAISSAEGWQYTFTEKPITDENGIEITYAITCDPVEWYDDSINGFNITLNYNRETTSKTVSINWNDNNNANRVRPSSVTMNLIANNSNYQTVLLSEANGWITTVNDLPTKLNGSNVTYSWTGQEVIGYTLSSVVENNNSTSFTYDIYERPGNPGGGKPPKTPSPIGDEYDEPL